MKNPRKYGQPPYRVAVMHGGPGAAGYMAPVAGELSGTAGILEPLQTAESVVGQAEELRAIVVKYGSPPVILIGHSWGAWLVYIVGALYPALVKKLILVGSGPFEQSYAANIDAERLNRLSEGERIAYFSLVEDINRPGAAAKDKSLARLGELAARADTYDALPPEKGTRPLAVSETINRKVMSEARELRASGELLAMGKKIRCPVVAVHGDYDPHPAEGVRGPLGRVLKDFRFVLMEKCGHYPWNERYARERFFEIIKNEIK